MKRRYVLLILLVTSRRLLIWAYTKKNEPPTVPFAKVKRETLVSTLQTNGKVEPLAVRLGARGYGGPGGAAFRERGPEGGARRGTGGS